MGNGHIGKVAEQTDSSLNDLVLKIRRARIDDIDAFTKFKQNLCSKSQLCEAIARELV